MQVPQLKLYRACIYDHQKKLITGISPTANTNANNELPRQNNDRDNAVLGAQGLSKFLVFEMISDWPSFSFNQPIRAEVYKFGTHLTVCLVEDDGPADWLDRFYTLIRVALLLMLAFNYASTGKITSMSSGWKFISF